MYEPRFEMPLIIKWPACCETGARTPISCKTSTTPPPSSTWPARHSRGHYRAAPWSRCSKANPDAPWRDAIYYHYFEYPSVHMVARHRGVRTIRFKLIHFYQFGEWEFYDLDADPQEQANQYDNPVVCRAKSPALKERLELAPNTPTIPTSFLRWCP
jgi:arylsulfatase A-like enzyme